MIVKLILQISLYLITLLFFATFCMLTYTTIANYDQFRQHSVLSDQSEQIDKLHTSTKKIQQSNSQIAAQISQLQQKNSVLLSQITKIQQIRAAAKSKVAYLTFDDGPSNLTPQVLKTLKENHIHATFFVVGQYAAKYPDIVKQAYDDGNTIGNHTWSHNYSTIYKSESNFFDDFNKAQTYLTDLLGKAPAVCRYPGGTNNTVSQGYSNHIMRLIDPAIKASGIKPYDWNAYAGDAESGPKPTPEKIVHNVISEALGCKTPVILFHDTAVNGNDLPALPEIIRQLRGNGYTFGVLTPDAPTCQFKPV